MRKRQRSVSFVDGLKDHDGTPRRPPIKRRILSKAAVNSDSDEEPDPAPREVRLLFHLVHLLTVA